MKATILVDNEAQEGLGCEWGFSVLIEADDQTVLLDSGATDLFLENASKLGHDISKVDQAVLSHAHYDHSDGFSTFLETNSTASLYLQSSCDETCWSDGKGDMRYIGIEKGLLAKYEDRIERVDDTKRLAPRIWLIGHTTPGLGRISEQERLFIKGPNDEYGIDDLSHEQTLVVEVDEGLVIFNSCSHSGIDIIIDEVRSALTNRPIVAYIGGLHLFRRSDEQVRELTKVIKGLNIKKIYAGHCTGERALEIFEEELGDIMERTYAGKVIEL